MPHKLLHTLVISSALALGPVGCAAAPPRPLEPVASVDAVTVESSVERVAWSGAANGGSTSGGSSYDAEPATSGPASALQAMRSCEDGWPTTKGARCGPVEQPDGSTQNVCCGSGGGDCCVQEPAQ